jgi:hypothetical protein
VPLMVTRGYPSLSFLHNAAETIARRIGPSTSSTWATIIHARRITAEPEGGPRDAGQGRSRRTLSHGFIRASEQRI